MSNQSSPTDETSDQHLTILADPHCQAVLTYFQDVPAEHASVERLRAEISKQDHGGPTPSTITLHHATLPRLDDTGVIEYDPRSTTARYRGHPHLESLLEALPDR